MLEKTPALYVYNSYGAAVSEVEVDTLTGQTEVARVDILYDCGERSEFDSAFIKLDMA